MVAVVVVMAVTVVIMEWWWWYLLAAYTQTHTKATASFTEISYPNTMSQYSSNSCDSLPQTNFFINSSGPNTPQKHIAFISTGRTITGPTGFSYSNHHSQKAERNILR